MKKFILVTLIALIAGTVAFADHEGLGIGIVGGGGYAGAGFGYPGLSLKLPSVPVFWGIYLPLNSNGFGFGLTGDYYFFDGSLVAKEMTNEDGTYKFKLDWYLGLGGFVNMYFWEDKDRYGNFNFDFGVRIPVGLSWHIITPLELFLGVHPGLGIWIGKYNDELAAPVHPFFNGEIGLRLWLK
jgi:opacity protein-like surface antigen